MRKVAPENPFIGNIWHNQLNGVNYLHYDKSIRKCNDYFLPGALFG